MLYREDDDREEWVGFKSFNYEEYAADKWTVDIGYCVQADGNDLKTWGTIIDT